MSSNGKSAAAAGEFTVEYAFHDYGDLGIRLEFAPNGDVIVAKLESVLGLAEKSCPDLHEGDVLVSINETSTIGIAFSDVMKLLRDTIHASSAKGADTTLTFVPVDGSFDTAEKAVEMWRHQDQSFKDDGEFEVYFPPSQPLGFRLTESFLMAKPLCLVSTSLPDLAPLLHHAMMRINDHVVLGAPCQDVLDLLHDPTTFPKRIWFWKIAQGHDKVYSVVTLPSPALARSIQLAPIDFMFEVPMVHSMLPTPRSKTTVVPTSSSLFSYQPPIRNDGVRKDQYLMAINGVSTLTVPNDENTASAVSTISTLHGAMEASLQAPRRLLFRDMDLYRASRETPLDRGNDVVTVEVVAKPFAALVAENASPMPQGETTPTEPVRRKWQHGTSRRVVIPPSTAPVGIQLETDFSSKFTVFKRYLRTATVKTNTICEGDRIVFVNGVPVHDIPTLKLEQLIMGHTEPRKFTIARKKRPSRGPWSAVTSWLHDRRWTPQIQHFHPIS